MSMSTHHRENHVTFDIRLARVAVEGKVALLRAYARFLGPKAAARWLVSRMDWSDFCPGRPTVLCLTRPLFEKDIVELRRHTEVNWVCINNEFIGHVQKGWVPPEMAVEAHYQKARGPKYERFWCRLEEFGLVLLEMIQQRTAIDAVLVSHIDYWHGEGLRLAAARLNIPFLALCREHMNLPHEQRTVREFYTGFRFEGQAVAVFGEPTRQIFVSSGACTPEQVWVTGAPRLDIWREIPLRREPRDLIVLLSYRDPDYLAPQSFREVLGLFVEAARHHEGRSEVRFLVKSKNRYDTQEILSLVGKRPENLEIDHEPVLSEVFSRTRLTVGFNSLSVLEALLADTAVSVPYWSDARSDPDWLMFDPADAVCRRAIRFPASPGELRELLDAAARGTLAQVGGRSERLACVERLIHVPTDRTASANVGAFVRHYIAEARDKHREAG